MLIVLQVGCRDRAFGASLGARVRSSPGLALARRPSPWAARVAGLREAARRLPRAHLGVAGLSGRAEARWAQSRMGLTARTAVFYGRNRKQHQSQ